MLADSLAQRVSLVQSSRERITSLGENWFISSVVKCTSLIHPPPSRFPSKSLFFPFFVSIRSALCSSPLVSPAYLLPPTSFLPSPITLSPLFLSPSVTVSRMFTTKPDVPDAVWH